ncbi:MAG: hypothetical protein GY762_01520 [Proteobacteria bacterium]|nr:hypothetical protein [Pseudomonadota bacterium]
MNYHWPGNVRELENVVERALILHKDGPLVFNIHSEDKGKSKRLTSSVKSPLPSNDATKLDDVIGNHIQHILELTEGKVQGEGGAAEVLGVNASTLRNRMRKLGIPYGRQKK